MLYWLLVDISLEILRFSFRYFIHRLNIKTVRSSHGIFEFYSMPKAVSLRFYFLSDILIKSSTSNHFGQTLCMPGARQLNWMKIWERPGLSQRSTLWNSMAGDEGTLKMVKLENRGTEPQTWLQSCDRKIVHKASLVSEMDEHWTYTVVVVHGKAISGWYDV